MDPVTLFLMLPRAFLQFWATCVETAFLLRDPFTVISTIKKGGRSYDLLGLLSTMIAMPRNLYGSTRCRDCCFPGTVTTRGLRKLKAFGTVIVIAGCNKEIEGDGQKN